MSNKYEITDIAHPEFPNLRRIRALREIDFFEVLEGELGGYVESEANLSQEGECWVADDACVYGNASVSGNAWAASRAQVYGNASVYDNALVSGDATVSENAQIFGNSWVYGNAVVRENARVYENAWVFEFTEVSGNAWVYGDIRLKADSSEESVRTTEDAFKRAT